MGTTQSTTLNTDTDAKRTSSVYGDAGDGVSRWFQWRRSADGGDATQGLKADAAVTDPTSSATVVAILKGILTFLRVSAAGVGKAEDAAAVSGDTGVVALAVRRDTAASSAGTDGDYATLNTDNLGRLRTTVSRTITNVSNTALAASLVVKASPGTLYGLQGYSTTAQFLHLYDATSLPADTAVPKVVIPITAGAPFSIDFGVYGRAFAVGIVAGVSSTGPTKTVGGADTWIDAQFE